MSDSEEQRELEKALASARRQQAAMADVFARLASGGAPDRSLERQLKERQAERDESLRAVGEALIVWMSAGGRLSPPGEDDLHDETVIRKIPEVAPAPSRGRSHDLPPEDDDTGETVFEGATPSAETASITRRRRRTVDGMATNFTSGPQSMGPMTIPPDPDSLKTLAETFGAGEPLNHTDAIAAIRAFMDAAGDFEPPSTPLEFLDGIQRLARVSDRTDRWKRLPRRVQQIFLAYGTCKARVWQENLDLGSSRHEVVLEQVFRALTRYSARERPGFVHGLSRSHRAERESWADDAQYWWTELALAANLEPEPSNAERELDELAKTMSGPNTTEVMQAALVHALDHGVAATDPRLLKMVDQHPEALDDEPRLRSVRRALRDSTPVDEDGPSVDGVSLIESDWPWMHVTVGKNAVIAGGDARPEATERVKAAFNFDKVDWHADPSDRRLDSLVQRIRGKNVDMLFFLARFGSHAAQSALRDACKDAGVPFVRIEHGYGVTQLKLAIENWMHGKQ